MRFLFTALVVCSSSAFAQFELDLTGGSEPKKAEPKKKVEPKKAEPRPVEPEIDLSTAGAVEGVLLVPPIVRVTQSQGGFSGFDTKKTFEKFDLAAHKRFVTSLQKQLEGKVLAADVTANLIAKEGLTVALSRTPAGLAKLAAAAKVGFIVTLELNKTGALAATIHDSAGVAKGEPVLVSNAAGLTQKNADELSPLLSKALIEAAKVIPPAPPTASTVRTCEQGCPGGKVCDPTSNVCIDEEVIDAPPPDVVAPVAEAWRPDPDATRVAVAVGGGGVLRVLTVAGEASTSLAELRNGAVAGLGVYAQVQPLQFIPSLAGRRWSGLEVEVHFRRAFVRATVVEGAATGSTCSMTDDDLQVRGSYRFKVAEGTYAPLVGLGGGWSQERTLFDACALPLPSAAYRGIDAQVRYRQPLFRNLLALDLSFGPRILQGDSATATRLSMAGEAWLELKPVSVLFVRGGARGSRLWASQPGLSLVENRFFFALEAGAFF